jgi:hypothetical protein
MLKYFWAALSFSGEPSSDGFAKHYELHYHPRRSLSMASKKIQQFGIINFHGKRGGEVGLVPTMKNKWSVGWTKAWFYCKVPLHPCLWLGGGATVHALRSHMSPLNFCLKSSVLDSAQDLSGDAFVWASQNIGCRDVVE